MAILKEPPTQEELRTLLGGEKLEAWERMSHLIDSLYEMQTLWSDGGKRWKFEYKYRRGGKTLCCLYADEERFGLMIIFGLAECEKVDALRSTLCEGTLRAYDEATTYHDGKWVMFDEALPDSDLEKLLAVKRKPSKV